MSKGSDFNNDSSTPLLKLRPYAIGFCSHQSFWMDIAYSDKASAEEAHRIGKVDFGQAVSTIEEHKNDHEHLYTFKIEIDARKPKECYVKYLEKLGSQDYDVQNLRASYSSAENRHLNDTIEPLVKDLFQKNNLPIESFGISLTQSNVCVFVEKGHEVPEALKSISKDGGKSYHGGSVREDISIKDFKQYIDDRISSSPEKANVMVQLTLAEGKIAERQREQGQNVPLQPQLPTAIQPPPSVRTPSMP